MKQELRDKLFLKYPKIFNDRDKSIDCGDGWFNIIDMACALIQSKIDCSRKSRSLSLKFNRALVKAIGGDSTMLLKLYANNIPSYTLERCKDDIDNLRYRDIPEKCSQFVILQIKQKFGSLRLYGSGGDEYIGGVIHMAESMSAAICESCGNRKYEAECKF